MRIQIVAAAVAVVLACAATAAQAQPAPVAPATAASAPATPDVAPAAPAPATTPAPAPPAASTSTAAAPAQVASGTPIVIEITQFITTKVVKTGDMFTLKLAEPIKYGDQEIVPAGTPGMGQVVDSEPSGFGGAPAKLVLAARYLELNGQHIPIHALKLGGSGKDNTTLALAASYAPYVGIASMLIHGGQMEILAGSRANAKLGVDLPVPDLQAAKSADPAPATAAAPQPTTTPQGTPQ